VVAVSAAIHESVVVAAVSAAVPFISCRRHACLYNPKRSAIREIPEGDTPLAIRFPVHGTISSRVSSAA
jgi:hypothetical protein